MTEYYKSRGLSEPVIYAQENGRWIAYDAQGSANESPGVIPALVLEHSEPITATEAEGIIRTRRDQAAAIASAVDETAIEKREGLLAGSAYTWAGTLKATPEQIGQVVAEWAERTGWSPAASGDGKPSYRFGRTSWSGGTWIKLATSREGGVTRIWLEAGARPAGNRRYAPRRIEYQRTAEHFANGVYQELAFQQGTLPPAKVDEWARTRERRRRNTRIMATAFWLIPAVFAALIAIIWPVTQNGFWVTSVLLWGTFFWLIDYILRLRSIGMRMAPLIACTIVLFLPLAVAFTALAATGSR